MYFARSASFAAVALALTACSSSSSSPTGPVIDDFTVSDTASVTTVNINGQDTTGYDINGSISFHDDAQNVTGYTVHLDVPGYTVPDASNGIPVQQQAKQVTGYSFHLILNQSASKGDVDLTVTLVDAANVKTTSEKKTVTLQ